MRIRPNRKHCLFQGLLLAALAPAALGQIQFRDMTEQRFPQPDPGEWTNQMTIADIDGSGALDIIFANGGNFSSPGPAQKVRVYVNDGEGFFVDESDARTGGVTGHFRGVEMGDVNSNGALDMGLANDFNQLPRLLMNDGNGFFTDETMLRLPNITMSSARVQFVDVNNNGHLDMFFVNGGAVNRFGCGPARLYMNDGDGFFTNESAQRLPSGNICGPMDAKFGDVNNNFSLDVRIGALGSNNSKLYINDGDGFFTDASSSVPPDSTCYSYDMGDINGNGRLDMVGVNALPGSVATLLLRNNGDGSWSNISSQISPNPSVDDNDSKFFDFNNNGHLDLIVGRLYGNALRLYENDGIGNFSEVTGLITPIGDPTLDIMVADLTGDGRLDIVTGQGETSIQSLLVNRIFINQGPADTIPPNIVHTEQLADTDDTAGPYVVRAFITDSHTADRNFHDQGIFLHYTVNGGLEQQVPMRFSGGTVYRAEIPGQSGGVIEYYATAIDHNDNLGTGPALSFTVTGEAVPGDLTGDGTVGVDDLLILLAEWGDCPDCAACPADLTGDCTVGVDDLLILLANWG